MVQDEKRHRQSIQVDENGVSSSTDVLKGKFPFVDPKKNQGGKLAA